jgi:hypothetical protein
MTAPSLGGLTVSVPETLAFTAIELGTGWAMATLGSGLQHFVGGVNLGLAVEENMRRAAFAAGFSEEEVEAAIEEQRVDTESTPENAAPSLIDVLVDPDDNRLIRVSFRIPTDSPPGDVNFDVVFSDFNEVTVEVPTEFETASPR